MRLFGNIYHGRRVFVTGHTGFKGSWLAQWLEQLGAAVCGFSADKAVSTPDHFSRLSWQSLEDNRGDVRDETLLAETMLRFQPEVMFHLAAQPLVRYSYAEPLETFETNVMGTANVLEACRRCDSVKAIVVITTDKVYKNCEWEWGYRETDTLGGHDPYAASKACAELVAESFRQSFFQTESQQAEKLLATVRAGNVIGGGDWAANRIIPDIVRAAAEGKATEIRMPQAVRPWQHVLEPLAAYLLIGQKLLEQSMLKVGEEAAQAWNIGPNREGIVTVETLLTLAQPHWNKLKYDFCRPKTDEKTPHETSFLSLDCAKARHRLGWSSVWSLEETVQHTIDWYRHFYENSEVLTQTQLTRFVDDAKNRGAVWMK